MSFLKQVRKETGEAVICNDNNNMSVKEKEANGITDTKQLKWNTGCHTNRLH